MSDHADSMPPVPSSDPEAVFLRHTFLWRFDNPEHRRALCDLGDLLYTLINEAGAWGEGTEPITASGLRAAALDLRELSAYLAAVSSDRFETHLDETSARLAERAERWSARVEAIACSIETELAKYAEPQPPAA